MPQSESEDVWYVTQSFYLLKIKCETFFPNNDPVEKTVLALDDDYLKRSLMQNPIFGRTLGASSSIMECISEINGLYRKKSLGTGPVLAASASLKLTRMWMDDTSEPLPEPTLDSNWNTILLTGSIETKANRLHLRAFKIATTIYYHRLSDSVAPRELAPYVSEVSNCLSKFVEICGGNYTLWPAFIASVEAFEEDVKYKFRKLFETTWKMGMGNRPKVIDIVERVWEIRAHRAAETRQQLGDVSVDWREVKRELQTDVLLL
jgi:hypothetical protein